MGTSTDRVEEILAATNYDFTAMTDLKPLSTTELQGYWTAFHQLKEGEGMMNLHYMQMPAWEAICTNFFWYTFLVGGGYLQSKHYGHCGVYRIFALAAPDTLGKPLTFDRISGKDPTGTLYIGHASSLSNRLNQFRRTFESREHSHRAASALKGGYLPGFTFTPSTLAMALLFTGRHSGLVEEHLIKAYINTFGDAPPLNYRPD